MAGKLRSMATLAAALLLVLPAAARPQQAIVGVVAEVNTAERIERAAVILVGANGVAYGAVLSDSAGLFEISVPAPGPYVLRAHRAGYNPTESAVIEVPAKARVEVRVNLRRNPTMLEGVTVYGDAPQTPQLREFHRRRALRQGYSFTRADFERLKATWVIDLMPSIPGYRPAGGGIVREEGRSRSLSLNFRRCPPAVYVDGYESKLGLFELFGGMPLDHVYGVEVFRTWSDTPGEYATSTCGVILIWTVAVEH